jgi:hypothetical protein
MRYYSICIYLCFYRCIFLLSYIAFKIEDIIDDYKCTVTVTHSARSHTCPCVCVGGALGTGLTTKVENNTQVLEL